MKREDMLKNVKRAGIIIGAVAIFLMTVFAATATTAYWYDDSGCTGMYGCSPYTYGYGYGNTYGYGNAYGYGQPCNTYGYGQMPCGHQQPIILTNYGGSSPYGAQYNPYGSQYYPYGGYSYPYSGYGQWSPVLFNSYQQDYTGFNRYY